MSIRIGSRGAPVSAAQTRLNELGSHVRVDGRYGRETATAVREFQRSHHLQVDGVVGRETARAMGLTDGFDAPAARSGRSGRSAPTATPPAQTTPPSATSIDPRRGALITPAENRDLTPIERTTLAANRMNARLDSYTQRGEPVPPEELTRARRLSQLMEIPLPLTADPTGEVNDFAVARGGLHDRLRAIDAH